MASSAAFRHEPGTPLQCLSIPIELKKEKRLTESGCEQLVCGLRVGGGIDQDPQKSPFAYPDTGIYVTHIDPGGPADQAGITLHDKILQVNGVDFTMLTHEKAVHYIKKFPTLRLLITRHDVA